MNLEDLSFKELVETVGGLGYYDDGSGQGCTPYPKFPKF